MRPIFIRKASTPSGDQALKAEHYSGNRIVKDVSFTVSRGEVFGLGGLVGAGRTELVRMIYGADPRDSGTLILDGKDVTPRNPKDAVNKGVFLVSEDRKGEGLFLIRSAKENLTISRNDRSFFLNLKKERNLVEESIQKLQIKVFSQDQEVGNLSGGNQQKVVISRWLLEEGDVYIFDEPTKGVDVGAREEIYKLIEKLAMEQKISDNGFLKHAGAYIHERPDRGHEGRTPGEHPGFGRGHRGQAHKRIYWCEGVKGR